NVPCVYPREVEPYLQNLQAKGVDITQTGEVRDRLLSLLQERKNTGRALTAFCKFLAHAPRVPRIPRTLKPPRAPRASRTPRASRQKKQVSRFKDDDMSIEEKTQL